MPSPHHPHPQLTVCIWCMPPYILKSLCIPPHFLYAALKIHCIVCRRKVFVLDREICKPSNFCFISGIYKSKYCLSPSSTNNRA